MVSNQYIEVFICKCYVLVLYLIMWNKDVIGEHGPYDVFWTRGMCETALISVVIIQVDRKQRQQGQWPKADTLSWKAWIILYFSTDEALSQLLV